MFCLGEKTIDIKGIGGADIARPRQTTRPPVKSDKTNINTRIKAREVRLIGPDGSQVGITPIQKALEAAAEAGLDLVEISPNANPPVCKIMDYGRFKYELTKKQQEAKKKQTVVQIKEIKVRPNTGAHDLDVKIGHIKRFIETQDKVKITVIFRGREITLSEAGKELLSKIAEETKEFAIVEQSPKFEGRTMTMILSPK